MHLARLGNEQLGFGKLPSLAINTFLQQQEEKVNSSTTQRLNFSLWCCKVYWP